MDEQKTLLRNDAFLGTGWSFPPVLTDTGVQLSRYEQDIRESLHVLFQHRARRAGLPLRLRLPPAPLRLRAAHHATISADAGRHQPRRDALRAAHRAGGRVVRGTARTGRAAGPPHLYRGAHQQPPQHGLSLLLQRRDQYRQCIT